MRTKKRRNHKRIWLNILVIIISLQIHFLSHAEWQKVLYTGDSFEYHYQWHQDENGWWFSSEAEESYYYDPITHLRTIEDIKYEYYINTWAIISDKNVGRLYCFDENGYLRTSQITPDGYYVNEDGALVADGKVIEIRYQRPGRTPSEQEWASGKPYEGRWISLRTEMSQTQDSSHSKQITALTGGPFEIRLERNADGTMKADAYELKNGSRIRTNTYDFLPYKDEKYVLDTGNGKEMFYPSTSWPKLIESYPTLTYDGTIRYQYYIVNE